jgi:hypothetical protein
MDIPYMTINGLIDLVDLRECDLMADKIADGLAKNNRYNGRTPVPWSVASHSVLVSHICPPGLEAWGLLHDAHEFLLGDFSRPSVDFIARPFESTSKSVVPIAIDMAKAEIDEMIGTAWALDQVADFMELTAADNIALEAEMFVFFGADPTCYGTPDEDVFERAVALIHELPKDTAWRAARDLWLERACHLASLGHLRLPADGTQLARKMRPATAQEKIT